MGDERDPNKLWTARQVALLREWADLIEKDAIQLVGSNIRANVAVTGAEGASTVYALTGSRSLMVRTAGWDALDVELHQGPTASVAERTGTKWAKDE